MDALLSQVVSSRTHVAVHGPEGVSTLAIAAVLERLAVDALVRLQARDYPHVPDGTFVHFNLGHTLNQPGRRYALLPILAAGRREPDGSEILPVVDPDRHRRALCVSVRQAVPLDALGADDFAHSLPSVRSVPALRAALVARYADLVPGLTTDEVELRGCAVSRFTVEQRS